MLELNNLRREPPSPSVNANIISLNTGMRFFRVKVVDRLRALADRQSTILLDDTRGRFRSMLSISSRSRQLFLGST